MVELTVKQVVSTIIIVMIFIIAIYILILSFNSWSQSHKATNSTIDWEFIQEKACLNKTGGNYSLTTTLTPATHLIYNNATQGHNIIIHCYDTNYEQHNYWVEIFCQDVKCTKFRVA